MEKEEEEKKYLRAQNKPAMMEERDGKRRRGNEIIASTKQTCDDGKRGNKILASAKQTCDYVQDETSNWQRPTRALMGTAEPVLLLLLR
jgi:hypothetical protein